MPVVDFNVDKVYYDGPLDRVYLGSELLWELPAGPPTPGLLGEWGFLDNLQDTSGNGRHGTFSGGGAPAYTDGPQPGTRALTFATTTSSVGVGRTGLEPADVGFTSMAWYRINGTSLGSNRSINILSKPRATFSGRSWLGALWTDNVKYAGLTARWKGDLHFVETVPGVNDNNWHHLAVSDGDTGWALYVDGNLIQSGVRDLAASPPLWEDYGWVMGNDTVVLAEASPLLSISGVRIIHGQLTQAQVQAWMNTPITA